MTELRSRCTGVVPVHQYLKASMAVAFAAAALFAPSAYAQPAAGSVAAAAATTRPIAAKPLRAGQSIDDFYKARNDAPLWLSPRAGDAADGLLSLLSTATIDRFSPGFFHVEELRATLVTAGSGHPKDVLRADKALSAAYINYVSGLMRDPGLDILYVDQQLKPSPPTPRGALLVAASAPSLASYVRDMGWMNPIYAKLRSALVAKDYASEQERRLIELNLQRARVLPAGPMRYLLVNAAQQRLYIYEGGKPIDSMRVVVGKTKYPTPMMTALIRFAALNPYWYVPPDLASERIAPNVIKRGLPYLEELGYEVLDHWDDDATVLDPATIDWKKVAAGEQEIFVRQKPGPHNSMGRMKFMFPNSAGVYLHDNPERELFNEAARLYSGGCVRLEDAARLGQWLFGRDLVWEGARPEERVMLPAAVPVYITYLTAMPEEGGKIAFFEDAYKRDGPMLAASDDNALAAAGR